MTVREYLKTKEGKKLSTLVKNYKEDAQKKDGKWWAVNCLHYVVICEVWTMFTEEHVDDELADVMPNVSSEKWFPTAKAEHIFKGIVGWASDSGDCGIVLTYNFGDDRESEFSSAIAWYHLTKMTD